MKTNKQTKVIQKEKGQSGSEQCIALGRLAILTVEVFSFFPRLFSAKPSAYCTP